MRLLLVAAAFAAALALAARNKDKDATMTLLIDVKEVPESCAAPLGGYGIVNGSLELCETWSKLQLGGEGAAEYEHYKCKHLRVHGEMKEGKCVCKYNWRGADCNEYASCDPGHSHMHNEHHYGCHPTGCFHDGRMAIGKQRMECICKGEWDGHHCERLACWRKSSLADKDRFHNGEDKKSCKCGEHYEGENCEKVKSCHTHGSFVDGACVCAAGYGGPTCFHKCQNGQLTCSTGSIFSALLALPIILQLLNRLL